MNNKTFNSMIGKPYIARIIDGREESVFAHSTDTAFLAEHHAPEMLKSTIRLAALLHDAGKNCDEFLKYIKKTAEDPGSVKKGSVTHSTAGAIIVNDLAGKTKAEIFASEIIRHAIISHHGINDCITPEGRSVFDHRHEKQQGMEDIYCEVYRYLPEDEIKELFNKSVAELALVVRRIAELVNEKKIGTKSFYWGMLERLLLSLLIDSDRTASACFAKNIPPELIKSPQEYLWDDLIEKLEGHLSGKPNDSYISRLRQEISSGCKVAGQIPERILRLVVPTGAGKTLSSLRYALYQAQSFAKKRIIYVAPFNSILEQNASEFRKALGNPGIDIILEHHSNLIPDDTEKYEELTQNWSSPIILTSAVQFLNALFCAKSGSIRRMHALVDSVIIVDEVQSIPIRCIALFNMAINFLAGICDTSIVLCSATQPPFDALPDNRLLAPLDMLPGNAYYQESFRRTRIIDKTAMIPGGMDAQSASQFVSDLFKTNSSILFISNTKACVETIYYELKERFSDFPDAPHLFHLSTKMCPMHRRNALERIKIILDNKQPIICISSQLVEAGVDFSFKTVVRSAAGLQNIIQAAGRCNRNAEEECGDVFIVKLADALEDLSNLKEIRDAQNAFYSLLDNLGGKELDSVEAMDEYYKHYFYSIVQTMPYPYPELGTTLVDLLSNNPIGINNLNRSGGKTPILAQAFEAAGKYFQVIEEKDMVDILVEYDEKSKELIARLNAELDREELEVLLPQLQPYTVSVSRLMLKSLGEAVYTAINGDINVLLKQYYSQETGVGSTPSQMDFYNTNS